MEGKLGHQNVFKKIKEKFFCGTIFEISSLVLTVTITEPSFPHSHVAVTSSGQNFGGKEVGGRGDQKTQDYK